MRLIVTLQMFFTALIIPAVIGFFVLDNSSPNQVWFNSFVLSIVCVAANWWLYREPMDGRAVVITAWGMERAFATNIASFFPLWIGALARWAFTLQQQWTGSVLVLCVVWSAAVVWVILWVTERGPWTGWKHFDD